MNETLKISTTSPDYIEVEGHDTLRMDIPSFNVTFEPLNDITPKEAAFCAMFFCYSQGMVPLRYFPYWDEIKRHFKELHER